MAFMAKFKDFMGIPQDEGNEEEEIDIVSEKKTEEVKKPAPQVTKQSNGNKVVNIHTTTQLQVVLVKPERFEDVRPIADHLNSKNTVVLNLESTNKDVSRRLVDFLSGVAYANQGQIKKVANSTYIITPFNVNIMGDLLDELESSGVYFG
ncbi:MAG: cell division protein SepF [Oscillospiraceae bacterium]|nr:cell division protein SepF [Oscillospiraceae bacterium]MBQ9939533.1 cell division protein SepF [Oscillospiraceae bacterium]